MPPPPPPPSKLLLTYHTCNVYASDRAIFAAPTAWLNDHCIHFYFDHLQHSSAGTITAHCRFVAPETVAILQHENDEDDFRDCVDGCDVDDYTRLVFFPINDNVNVSKGGGSHWSLLMFDRSANTFRHFDSMGASNESIAETLTVKLHRALSLTGSVKFVSHDSVRQSNSYDCGMFVLVFAELLAAMIDTGCDRLTTERINHELQANATPGRISETRQRALRLIDQLSNAG